MNKVSSSFLKRPVLTKLIRANGVSQPSEDVHIVANELQRAALAKINKLADLTRLEARLTVKPHGKELRVRGVITADVVYNCVRTLEPFPATVIEKVDVTFAQPKNEQHHRHVDLSFGDDEQEVLVDGQADVGALVQEFFQLALDPYPHKPGAQFEGAGVLPDNAVHLGK